jgi:hypothetical protein
MADADSKVCRCCGLTLPLDSFYRNSTYKGGRASICRTCHCEKTGERYHKTKVLRPLSPTQVCAHCGKDFPRPQPKRPGDPPRSSTTRRDMRIGLHGSSRTVTSRKGYSDATDATTLSAAILRIFFLGPRWITRAT